MTKEEILEKHIGAPIPLVGDERCTKTIEIAMDEYAKQQAIAFAQHMFQNVWEMNGMSPSPHVSHDQLYSRFIESQNK